MAAVTAFGSSVCNCTKGGLLIHASNRRLLRPDAHQRGFLGLINFGSGLIAIFWVFVPVDGIAGGPL